MLPVAHDALGVVDHKVERRVMRPDVPRQPHFRTHALSDDVAVRLHHPDLGAAFEPGALGDDAGAAAKHPAVGMTSGGIHESSGHDRAYRLAHDKQISTDNRPRIAMGGQVDEIIRHDDVARIEQRIQAADSGLGKDAL